MISVYYAILLAEFDLADVYYTTVFAVMGITLAILLGTATYFGVRWYIGRERLSARPPETESPPEPSPDEMGERDVEGDDAADRWTMGMDLGI
ncbi:hypothetical protein KIPB_006853 [Kipferlia bialata]|uniref:Uncharacterized protein n=1 Tax=Kipferlia bialata TaxID=797122 RepID=A0A9K3CYD3_9EUKA|nr:hypothetical protein KIPB_006853 [Kipferlia bialata]|eukprot:g6853.t1